MHDIADIDGMPVLSMQDIDGEDSASLSEAHRTAAGGQGTRHRQENRGRPGRHNYRRRAPPRLKTANIMLDGRGGVRITDFGLAVAVDAGPRENDVSGTPGADTAPEQFTGGGASVRSDIYGLGLVLDQLYTGRTASRPPRSTR